MYVSSFSIFFPKGFLYCVGNDLSVMPPVSPKVDIFSFGLLTLLQLLNEEGPRHLQQMGTLLLSINLFYELFSLCHIIWHRKLLYRGFMVFCYELDTVTCFVQLKENLYAVKKTALRWREVLIMPKLRHPNILRVMAMFVGTPIPEYPRRRFMYQFYPRMKSEQSHTCSFFVRESQGQIQELAMSGSKSVQTKCAEI